MFLRLSSQTVRQDNIISKQHLFDLALPPALLCPSNSSQMVLGSLMCVLEPGIHCFPSPSSCGHLLPLSTPKLQLCHQNLLGAVPDLMPLVPGHASHSRGAGHGIAHGGAALQSLLEPLSFIWTQIVHASSKQHSVGYRAFMLEAEKEAGQEIQQPGQKDYSFYKMIRCLKNIYF